MRIRSTGMLFSTHLSLSPAFDWLDGNIWRDVDPRVVNWYPGPLLRYMGDRSSFLDTMFSTRRGMIEWFTKHLPNDDSDWIDLMTAWMAIRREIEEGRAHVPEDLKEAVGGVLLAYRLDHNLPIL